MSGEELTFIEELLLLEMSSRGQDKPPTRTELRKTAMANDAGTGLNPDIDDATARLVEKGLAEQLPRAHGGKSDRWKITQAGQDALTTALGGWDGKGRTYKQKGACILAARHFLGLPARSAVALVVDRALPAFFLAGRLGEEFAPGMTLDALARRAAAGTLGVSNDQPATLWNAVRARALAGKRMGLAAEHAGGADEAAETDRHSPSQSTPGSVPFHEQISRAAGAAVHGWLGPRKLFIHRAWEAWKAVTGETADLAEFKVRLLDALRTGHLALARADFTAGIDPNDLAQAETKYLDEVFYFISFPEDRRP